MERIAAREALQARRTDLRAELERLRTKPAQPVTAVSFGKRIGDGTTEAVERINATAAARSLAASLAQVERAIAKLDEGTYGRCDDCGEPIPDARLEAIPSSVRCVRCTARHAGTSAKR